MQQKTFRIQSEVVEYVEGEAEDRDVSESEVIRELLDMGMQYDDLQNKNDELRNQLQARNRESEVNDKVVRYVENDIDFHEAGIVTKLRWYVFGKD